MAWATADTEIAYGIMSRAPMFLHEAGASAD